MPGAPAGRQVWCDIVARLTGQSANVPMRARDASGVHARCARATACGGAVERRGWVVNTVVRGADRARAHACGVRRG
eukprot:5900152-Prymnesium_polylepis.2